jgi:osmotically-inducible protein OsmY
MPSDCDCRLKHSLSFIQSRSVTIEVSPEDHSAILRGAVPSEADRQQTELLVMFEPGIQKVVNELTVDSNLPPIPRRRRASNSVRD